MEPTLFSAWIYDTLTPYAGKLVMGHPDRMKAITAGKKKGDAIDARTIADLLRCDLSPTCYVLPPEARDLRRLLRYCNMGVRMQNKRTRCLSLLMESGTSFVKDKLHGKGYFAELMGNLEERNLVDDLARKFLEHTIVQSYYLPSIHAQLSLNNDDPSRAIEVLQAAVPYELSSSGALYPVYVRGTSYLAARQGKEAAKEFQKVLDHRLRQNPHIGIFWSYGTTWAMLCLSFLLAVGRPYISGQVKVAN